LDQYISDMIQDRDIVTTHWKRL